MPNPAVYNATSTGANSSDAQILMSLMSAIESQSAWDQQRADSQVDDSRSRAATRTAALDTDSPIRLGRVLLAMPYIHCYRVMLSDRSGVCIATATGRGAHAPIGVKIGETIPPNSEVILWKPKSSLLAYILAVVPGTSMYDDGNISDFVQQGGNSGIKKIEAYRNIIKSESSAYGWLTNSNGRPMDGTLNEYVRMSETGIGLLIDSFQAYLRVNEACGLFLNYFDSTTKLTGLNLSILSHAVHDYQLHDEGELAAIKGYATYPWEAAGMYASGEQFTQRNTPAQVQLDREFPFASVDLAEQDQTPFYRLTEYHGYLGQGESKFLVKPPAESGKRLLRDAETPDTGLYQEATTLDGGHSIRSAKYVILAKYPVISSPRRRRQPDDGLGDDATSVPDYKFSGEFGPGQEHIVNDWTGDDGDIPNMLRPAAVMDELVRHHNWKSTHAFHYHTKDYAYANEAENRELNAVDFARGSFTESVKTIYPKKLQIDKRYGQATYYENASIVALAEDGSIVLIDGYGSRLFMGGGQIRLEASGDCTVAAGGRVVLMGKEVVTRAKDHVDISASEGEVRLKSEHNMQLLAGNSGTGGMLLESKGTGTSQDYAQKIGDEVVATGITLLSRGGGINHLGQQIYMRTGLLPGNAEGSGDLILDVANGRSQLVGYASQVSFFSAQGLGLWMPPQGQDSVNIEKCTYFGPYYSQITGPTTMYKDVAITHGGNLGVDASVFANDHVIACKYVAANRGIEGIADSSKNNIPADVAKFIRTFEEAYDDFVAIGRQLFPAFYTNRVWTSQQPGNNDLLENHIGFSYRDTSRYGKAYGYDDGKFQFLETWWQTMSRMGYTTAGEKWTEKPVQYQGEKLYPWPGRINWVEKSTFTAYREEDRLLLFDGTTAVNRREHKTDYEQPEFGGWKKKVCDGNYEL